jgi:hypothetical protein
VQVIRGAIDARDLARFDLYAHRIQELIYLPNFSPGTSDCRIDRSVYLRLGLLLGASPLLPSLRVLQCFPATEMLLFSSRNLSSISLEMKNTNSNTEVTSAEITTDRDRIAGIFLCNVAEENPRLMHLVINGNLTRLSLTPLSDLKDLQSLALRDTTSLDQDILHGISTLTHLVKLEIDLRGYVHTSKSALPPEAFQSLRDLTIFIRNVDQISWLGDCTLRSIEIFITPNQISFDKTTFEQGWQSCFEMLRSRSFESLRRVQVKYLDVTPTLEYTFMVGKRRHKSPLSLRTRTILEPLLQIPGLECVELLSYPPLRFSDEDIREVSSAWPRIVTLSLPNATTEQPTFASLQHLAAHCTHLTSLTMNINTEGLTNVEFGPSLNHPLRNWSSGTVQFDNPTLLVRHLHHIFPSLNCTDLVEQHVTLRDLLDLCRVTEKSGRQEPTMDNLGNAVAGLCER